MARVIRTVALAAVLVMLNACDGTNDPGISPDPTSTNSTGGMTNAYTVSATVKGLSGPGLTLALNEGQAVPVAGNGPMTFSTVLANGAAYAVTVQTQPSTPRELCGISSASGTIDGANVTNVAINCAMMTGFLYQAQGFVQIQGQPNTNDQIFSYGITAGTGALVPFGKPVPSGSQPGSAPTIAAAPSGKFLYVGDELSSTISIYAVDSDTGALTALDSVSTPGLEPIRMQMTAGGFLFVSSYKMGPTSLLGTVLSTYAVDSTTGALTPAGTTLSFDGNSWLAFAATPDGTVLYLMVAYPLSTQAPQTLTAYAIDPASGALTAGPAVSWNNNDPNAPTQAIAIDPSGRYLYLSSVQSTPMQAAATVLPYAIDPGTGTLAPIGGGTPVASQPSDTGTMVIDPSGRYMYLLDQLNYTPADHTVTALAIDESTGEVSVIGSASTDGDPGSVLCDPSGRFVYVVDQNSAPAELAAFTISTGVASAGQLAPIGLYNQLAPTQFFVGGSAIAVVE